MSKNEKTTAHPEDVIEIDLSVILKVFLQGCFRFWWLVAVLMLLGAGFMCLKSVMSYSPMYSSQATFTVTTNTEGGVAGDSYNFYYDSSTAEQLGLTFPHILSSQLLTDAIKSDLGIDALNATLSASTIVDSNMVTMYCKSSDPEQAKRVLESALKVYPDVSRFVIGATKFNMIDPPELAEEPYNSPDYMNELIKGILIGFALGMLFIIVYAFLRKTVHKNDELQKHMNLPCYVSLPFVRQKTRKSTKNNFPTIYTKDVSPWFTENAETLKLRVEKELSKSGKKTLLVTSTVPGEGKSLVAVNLAMKLAKNGKKVVLVDADLRKQNLASNIGIKVNGSLEKLLEETHDVSRIVHYDKKRNLMFIGGDKPFKDTSRFLTKQMKGIIEILREKVDYIIIDTPPASDFEDAVILKDYVDSVLYVVRQDFAPKSKIIETISVLEAEQANIMGYVFNAVTGVLGTYGYGKYGSYGRYGRYGHYSRYGHYGKYSKYSHYSKYGYSDISDR